jgi:diguanylate cyclase (GGDEF)-like protein/PAS domain S-box-containing protein
MDAPMDLQLHDAALAATTNGIVIADAAHGADYAIRYVNPGFERITGYRAEDVIGQNCRFLQGPGTDAVAAAELGAALREQRATTVTLLNYRADGRPFWNEISLSPVSDGVRMTHVIGVQSDVTDRIQAEEQVRFLAYHDSLTGLANRARVQERLGAAVERARAERSELALLYVDLDRFKHVNDRLGHAAGDELLRQVTERLGTVVRPSDLLARQGGDEFLIVLGGLKADAARHGAEVARRVGEALRPGFLLAGELVDVSASIGVSGYPRDARDVADLLRHADDAMYAAKADGGGGFSVYGATVPAVPAHPPDRPDPAADPEADAAELERILAGSLVRAIYQPIVRLEDSAVVAYEALARGPEGSPLERPDLLFPAAAAADRLPELDAACRAAAVRGAVAAGLRPPSRLFLNVEPGTLTADARIADELGAAAGLGLEVVVELTERALIDRPAAVISTVQRLRDRGVALALDDVGADRRSLAFMPFVAPDVIKLDLRLVQSNPDAQIASIVHAVSAEAERSGAIVLAEGIETEAHRHQALALGASHGQGWLFGRPGPLPAQPPAGDGGSAAAAAVPVAAGPAARGDGDPVVATPFELVSAHHRTRRGSKRLLLAISKHLEAQAAAHGDAAVVLATFQEARHFTDASRGRYARLGQSAAFVGALGVGLASEPIAGVRGAALDEAEPLRGEWNVVVVTPHFAAAFVARDLDDRGPDMDRRFDFCMTYDRDLAVQAAAALMDRIAPR